MNEIHMYKIINPYLERSAVQDYGIRAFNIQDSTFVIHPAISGIDRKNKEVTIQEVDA